MTNKVEVKCEFEITDEEVNNLANLDVDDLVESLRSRFIDGLKDGKISISDMRIKRS